ncbi:MAG: hypothetical protein LBU32_23880 [Clostridiales bacterium]|jgi:hypothetical protein|nr:hypothetical protein [Clostridiales bacterium]
MTARKQKGIALPLVCIVITVVTILAGIVFNLFNANLILAVQQEKKMQAHYFVLTGLEMGTAALLKEDPNYTYPYYPPTTSILNDFNVNPWKYPLEDTIILPNGKVFVKISSPPKPGSPFKWIRIEALGTYIDEAGKEYVDKGSVWYRADNPEISETDYGN